MRVRHSLTTFAVLWLLAAPATADDSPWMTDLEQAKALAEKTNRLVLIHFGASWCDPCQKMEQNVFGDAALYRGLAPNFVLVKLDLDENRPIARQYRVKTIPQDVIITPDGDVLGTSKFVPTATKYLTQIRGIAASAGRLAPAAQVASGGAQGRNAGSRQIAGANAAVTASHNAVADNGGHGYRGGDWPHGQPSTVGPRYGGQQSATPPATGPNLNAPGSATAPATENVMNWGASAQAVASDQEESARSVPTDPFGGDWTRGVARPPASRNETAGTASHNAFGPRSQPAADGPTVGPSGHANRNAPRVQTPSPAHPPLALQGLSPVATIDGGRWVRGNPRWGAIHNGRTYFFANQDEQQKFLKNFNKYAPVLDGVDLVVLAETGRRVEGQLASGAVLYPRSSGDRRLFLFSSRETMDRFERNPEHYIARLRNTGGVQPTGPPTNTSTHNNAGGHGPGISGLHRPR